MTAPPKGWEIPQPPKTLKLVKRPDVFKSMGRNFMTPDILGFYKLREGYAELSTGEGMSRQPVYGVTVIPDEPVNARSKLCQSEQEALDYIRSMS